jgi:hypothetical protein
MLNLSATAYTAIRDVFGTVLEKRSKHDKPDCALLNLLATRHYLLELLNEDSLLASARKMLMVMSGRGEGGQGSDAAGLRRDRISPRRALHLGDGSPPGDHRKQTTKKLAF